MGEQKFSEPDAGITEYIGDHPGFFGIIKQRFSDFHVHEISSDDEIVHLTSLDLISPPEVYDCEKHERPSIITPDIFTLLELLSGQKTVGDVKMNVSLIKGEESFHIKCHKPTETPKEVRILATHMTKAERAKFHGYIKSTFSNLCTTTFQDQNEKYLIATRKDNGQRRRKEAWAKCSSYTTFVLYKENMDTNGSINAISGKLRMRPQSFAFAGMKDKRGKTSQLVSAYQVYPRNLLNVCKSLWGIHVGNFSFQSKPQKLGNLKGNHFTIALREVKGEDDAICASVESLSTNGFLNYYGMQRFGGDGGAPTHLIGKAILTSKWKEALNLIMSARTSDASDIMQAREVWNTTHIAHQALLKLKPYHRNSIEGCLLAGLAEEGNNCVTNALDRVPRTTRLIYIHAYQSYIWNYVVSKRVNKFGLKVLAGDLIRVKKYKDIDGDSPLLRSESPETMFNEQTEDTEDGNNADTEKQKEDAFNAAKELSESVHIVTESEVSSIDITQVILPLPGHKVLYPQNEIKHWYEELLHKDDLSSELFNHKNKVYSLTGSYRNILVMPQNFTVERCFYNNPLNSLIQSDFERLKRINIENNRLQSGAYKGMVLSFSLPTSAYATMALREMLKMETSSQYQTSLNSAPLKSKQFVDVKDNDESQKFENTSKNEKKDDVDTATKMDCETNVDAEKSDITVNEEATLNPEVDVNETNEVESCEKGVKRAVGSADEDEGEKSLKMLKT